MNNSRKTIVVYDYTRLFQSLERIHPSGIDRVDINYLSNLFSDDDYIMHGVLEISIEGQSYLIKLDDEIALIICNHFSNKWIANSTSDEEFSKSGKNIKNLIIEDLNKTKFLPNIKVDRNILGVQRFAHDAIYLNCTFINIPDGKQHQRLIAATGLSPVYLIHDLIHIEYPEYSYSDDSGEMHLNRLIAALELNAKIIAISDAVKTKIKEVAEILGYKNINIITNRSGVENKFLLNKNPITEKKNQFVYISTIEPRKNHLMLLNVWREIIATTGDKASIPKLIIIGRRGWNSQQVFSMLDKSPTMKSYIIEKNNANDKEIINDIKESIAMLFPSFDEGWGLPVVEAMALGTPVICSDIPVLHESSQENGLFISPIDGSKWKEIILKASKRELNLTLNEFKPITWESSFLNFKLALNHA